MANLKYVTANRSKDNEMTGEELYDYYIDANFQQNVEIEDWEDLNEADKEIWNYTAMLVESDGNS